MSAIDNTHLSTGPAPDSDTRYDPDIPVFAVLATAFRHPFIVVAVTLLVTGLAVAAAFLMTPVYQVEVVLAPVSEDGAAGGGFNSIVNQFGGLASLAGVQLGSQETVSEAIATLESRAFTEALIRDHNLLPVLFADDWDEERGEWTVSDPDDVPSLWDGYELFDEEIRTVIHDVPRGLVRLIVEWKDAGRAAEWANEMVDRVNAQMRDRVIHEAQQTIDYLNSEIEKTTIGEVRQAMYGLIEAQIKAIALARVREDYSFRIIDPAVAPDKDEFVRPQRLVMIVGGFIFGLFLGIAAAGMWQYLRQSGRTAPAS